jgi:uridine monophosphate synthetase
MLKEELILKLHDIQAIKFGEFTLKSGISSPLYIDLRLIVSYPELMQTISKMMWNTAKQLQFDVLCGVPYTALPIATSISLQQNRPMIMRRKEVKNYGTKKAIEGLFTKGQTCLVIEDLITSGASILETTQALEQEGLKVTDAIFLIDREQGGRQNLAAKGYQAHAILTISEVLETLQRHQRLDATLVEKTHQFLRDNQTVQKPAPKELSYGTRAKLCSNPMAATLLTLMEEKQTNLSFNPDVTSKHELLRLADLIGPEICILKTHIDMIEDFDQDLITQLVALAQKHRFLIFEDRKFADIGSTVKTQYAKGIYHIADWAHITNAHMVPGPGIIEGLKQVGQPKGRGLLLLAEMSSEGTLANGSYTEETVKQALKHKDFVIGFVAMRRLTDDPAMIHLTPGVQMEVASDGLGQQFKTPQFVIEQQKSDIIQVGRGIFRAPDPLAAAKLYRQAGWASYTARLTS